MVKPINDRELMISGKHTLQPLTTEQPIKRGKYQHSINNLIQTAETTISTPDFDDNQSIVSKSSTSSVSSLESTEYDGYQALAVLPTSAASDYNRAVDVQDIEGDFEFSPQDRFLGNSAHANLGTLGGESQTINLQPISWGLNFSQYQQDWMPDRSSLVGSRSCTELKVEEVHDVLPHQLIVLIRLEGICPSC